ncbi:hypothetical protein AB4114_30965 [Paenibacillus sp. 2RAB27]
MPFVWMLTTSLKDQTLPIAMKLFTDTAGTDWHLLMAASMMATVPT